MKTEFTIRKATTDDQTDILTVLKEVAKEIPISLDDSIALRNIKEVIITCTNSGETLVACNSEGAVIGFVLAKPDPGFREAGACWLQYVGVTKAFRRRGVLAAMLTEMKAAKEPLIAEVLTGNQSGMTDGLTKAGFVETASTMKQKNFRWPAPDPGIL